jgi:hypothetical protein
MKQQLLRAASTCALIAGMSGAAFAQGSGTGGSSSPGGGSTSPPSQTEQQKQKPGSGSEARSREGGSAGETVRPKRGGAAEGPAERKDGKAGSTKRSDDKSAPRSERRSDTRDDRQSPHASGDGKRDDQRRASDRGQEKDRTRAEQQRGQDRDRTRQGQSDRGQSDRGKADLGKDGADRRRDSARQDRDGAVKLSEQQRTTVRQRFSRSGIERNRVTNVNFDIRIGASVPRTVALHVLPPDVVEIVPAYRSYRYVYVGDEILIVDPGSYAVIAVIGSDGRSTAAVRDRRSLVLAPADRVFVREHIDTGAAITLGIGGVSIGMSVPQGLALRPLPSVVVERVPDLRNHRYFVHNDDIVIVDPDSDEVTFVLED